FTKCTGIGIKTYFNKLKVNKAKVLLKEGNSVSDTAYALGFTDQNYFSTMFKRITGNPPTFYKNNLQ
ncbi:MAG: helix-turn-helix transcriptional regulator, partial [Clostridia bacterium]|nr:helix-turn-helix transcriptional regulator [Clostridia bacterium]